jgi:hypothetical protein
LTKVPLVVARQFTMQMLQQWLEAKQAELDTVKIIF